MTEELTEEETRDVQAEGSARLPHQVRLPGFILDEDVGLGSVVKRVTSAFGIRPCGGCEQRAATLNRWLVFTGRRPK
jgi:hypothetical protein